MTKNNPVVRSYPTGSLTRPDAYQEQCNPLYEDSHFDHCGFLIIRWSKTTMLSQS
ncbi:hypothetical protein HCP88_003465 [Escherichia coli]|uniref:hypothetical protein n=1 Tax=Enterobacteriaceae TaxID=543 RepID=UPI0015EED40C|nr:MULTISPECIES: hypothetical protein [Enterobacteriaceae]EFM2410596.1 hypothetical protein [Escherichia coli]UFD96629.1 hypothetical protein [Klebsiella oxytoca]